MAHIIARVANWLANEVRGGGLGWAGLVDALGWAGVVWAGLRRGGLGGFTSQTGSGQRERGWKMCGHGGVRGRETEKEDRETESTA